MYEQILAALQATLDPQQREQGEALLDQMHKISQFAPLLLQIVSNDTVEGPIRQAGVIFLKNLVLGSWVAKEVKPGEPLGFNIHEDDRVVIRNNIVDAIINVSELLRCQLCVCVQTIIKHDFPERWPSLPDKLLTYLQNEDPNQVVGASLVLYQMVKTYEYKKSEECKPRDEVVGKLMPLLLQRSRHLLDDPSEIAAHIQKITFKILYAFVQYNLPKAVMTHEVLSQWFVVFQGVLEQPVPEAGYTKVEEDERPELIWWKAKKWVLHILVRVFERYGSPGNVAKEYEPFAKEYIKRYAAGVVCLMLKVFERKRNGEYISPRVLQQTLNYLNNSVNYSQCWKILKFQFQGLIESVVFPMLCHSDEDDEVWANDPHEYIRSKYDIFEEFVSHVSAAQMFIHSAVSKRRNVLQPLLDMCVGHLMAASPDPRQVDGALHLVGAVSEVLMKRKLYKAQLEEMLVKLVYPRFKSPHPYLRSRACWVLQNFSELKFDSVENLAFGLQSICELLVNKEEDLPVRVGAGIALQSLIAHQDHVQRLIGEQSAAIPEIMNALLDLIRDTENDDLNSVVQKLICEYGDQVAEHADDITKHLVETFIKVIEGNELGGDDVDDKAMTAAGILTTIETLLDVLEDNEEIMERLEPSVLVIINHVFLNSVVDFYEEVLSLVYSLTTTRVSSHLWSLFLPICNLFDSDTDYFLDIMPVMHNYISVGPEAFLAEPDRLERVISICQRVMAEETSGDDFQCHAGKLLEVLVLQFANAINNVLPRLLEIPVRKLMTNVDVSELRQICLQVVIAAFFNNPQFVIGLLDTITLPSGSSFTECFIGLWIADTDVFLGVHDRKVCILGLCTLLQSVVNGLSVNNALVARIIPSIILLLNGIRAAYAKKAENEKEEEEEVDEEEAEEDTGDDEVASDEEVVDADVQEIVNGDTKPIIDLVNGLSDTESDDDDDDSFDETQLESYTTPLDSETSAVDEFVTFKDLLESLNSSNPDVYKQLTGSLNADQLKDIRELFTLADQRKAAADSRRIEAEGGYQFVQTAVPGQFNFVGPIPNNFEFGNPPTNNGH